MEKGKNNNGVVTGLIISITIITILIILCVLFATGTIDLKNSIANNNEIPVENCQANKVDSNNEEQILALGLSMLKFANGATGYFSTTKTGDERYQIDNYSQVAALFTDEFVKNAQKDMSRYHICWPIKEGNQYYVNTNCGFGGPQSYTYKSIKISKQSDKIIDYIITYDEYDLDTKQHKDIEHNFQLVLVDNMWKINDYYNI